MTNGAMDKSALDEKDVKYVGRIPGRYTLPHHKSQSGITVFACRTQGITPRLATVAGPVSGKVGDPVSANFDDLGMINGYLCGTVLDGFRMEIDPLSTDVEKLAARIEWVKKRSTNAAVENRKHKRVLPRAPRTTLYLANGSRMRCFIIDMSASGVAVSADLKPPVGTPLAIGSVVGRVVRLLPHGFAVQFVEEQDLAELEQFLVRIEDEAIAI